jgi:zinc/manganese transport system substrate-binding protein
MLRCLAALTALLALAVPARAAAPLPVVAAENVYGDIAAQIGGPAVQVASILSSPEQDPHLFEASPSAARAVAAGRVAIYNGAGYDPWMTKLLAASPAPQRIVIEVAAVAGRRPGDNPHLWYDPAVMLRFATALAGTLAAADPPHQAEYRQRLQQFRQSMQPVLDRIASVRAKAAGAPVTATEPVFGCMFDALGLAVRNAGFQTAVMNDTEPAAADIAAFERDLRTHRVRLLVFNTQASDRIAERMRRLAQAEHVPVLGVTETEPAGLSYQAWMLRELDAVAAALGE